MGAADLVIVGIAGPRLGADERRALLRHSPGGVILFGRNVESVEQLSALVAELRAARPGLLVYLDAEGGRVDRLRTILGPSPSAASLAAQPPRRAGRAGVWMGRALCALGFDVDFAPVVDLDRGHTGNALDGRCFGATPRAVTARAGSFLRGLHAAGVGACLKHFPGLGGAQADTHLRGAPIELGSADLRRDLASFARLAGEAGAVMINHASYAAYDADGRPGTLSAAIGDRLLRRHLGFRGVAFSDDMEMKALGAWGDMPEVCAQALAAGCDVLATCGPASLETLPGVARRLSSPALRERAGEATARLERYRRATSRLRKAAEPFSIAEVRSQLERLSGSLH